MNLVIRKLAVSNVVSNYKEVMHCTWQHGVLINALTIRHEILWYFEHYVVHAFSSIQIGILLPLTDNIADKLIHELFLSKLFFMKLRNLICNCPPGGMACFVLLFCSVCCRDVGWKATPSGDEAKTGPMHADTDVSLAECIIKMDSTAIIHPARNGASHP